MIQIEKALQDQVEIISNGSVVSPRGFSAGGLFCGIRRKRLDLGWIYSYVPASAAAVYTTNLFKAAPLKVSKESIDQENRLQGVIVNSGNANACTGERGLKDAYTMRDLYAAQMGIEPHLVAVLSTGVIGEFLPMEKIQAGISRIGSVEQPADVVDFEEAIQTTDTCRKSCAVKITIDGKLVSIGGAAKGSGMIHPNMATMLGFITTDAAIDPVSLQQALRQVTNKTFNMITVDGDTSTNDMVLIMANGMAENLTLNPSHKEWPKFINALEIVCRSLAKKIARDGEGASRLVEVTVKGALNDQVAAHVAKEVIGSNLVKTAIFGADPNWGRIICAIGYSKQPIDPEKVTVHIGPIKVVENSLPCGFNEEEAKNYLQQENIHILIELNQADGQATAWGCDLSYDYVRINASYRT